MYTEAIVLVVEHPHEEAEYWAKYNEEHTPTVAPMAVDEIANALKTNADRWQIIEELMAEKVKLNLTIAELQSKDTVILCHCKKLMQIASIQKCPTVNALYDSEASND